MSPQGGLYASTADLARVMRMLMNHGTIDGNALPAFAHGRRHVRAAVEMERRERRELERDHAGLGPGKPAVGGRGRARQGRPPRRGRRLHPVGHTGDAYGLHGGFFMDRDKREGIIFLASGTGFDPATAPGKYSGKHRYEERIVDAIYRRALRGAVAPP
jgi:CubicO group peptidase (beta-lactamase class C family)